MYASYFAHKVQLGFLSISRRFLVGRIVRTLLRSLLAIRMKFHKNRVDDQNEYEQLDYNCDKVVNSYRLNNPIRVNVPIRRFVNGRVRPRVFNAITSIDSTLSQIDPVLQE